MNGLTIDLYMLQVKEWRKAASKKTRIGKKTN